MSVHAAETLIMQPGQKHFNIYYAHQPDFNIRMTLLRAQIEIVKTFKVDYQD